MVAARMEELEVNRTRDEFLAMLGHELRNPLTPILAMIDLLRLKAHGHLGREHQVIERQTRHLARLVDDLMDITRIARGKMKLDRRPVQLAAIVARAAEEAAPLVENRRHRLTIDLRARLAVDADEDRMVQVVANLLINAAKYSGEGGRIEVVGRLETDQVVLRVRDSGRGIAPELLPLVFQPFRQGPQSQGCVPGGLGLGLAVVRSLVQLHGGSVEAASAGAGKGSEFTVRLPALRATSRLDGQARPERQPVPTGQRVLVVDDNQDTADIFAELLRKQGHVVEVAYGGCEALERAVAFHPVLAFIDIGLPGMDGYDLARRIKADCRLSDMKLVAVTGYGQADHRRRALQAGFSEHLVKPVEFARLASIVDACARRPALRAPRRGKPVAAHHGRTRTAGRDAVSPIRRDGRSP